VLDDDRAAPEVGHGAVVGEVQADVRDPVECRLDVVGVGVLEASGAEVDHPHALVTGASGAPSASGTGVSGTPSSRLTTFAPRAIEAAL